MTIFSMSAMGLYAWINAMLIGTARMDDVLRKNQDVVNALELIRTVNPMEEPRGSVRLGAVEVSWQSDLLEPGRAGTQIRLFEFGLFEMEVLVEHSDRSQQTLVVRQLGYSKREGAGEFL